MWVETRHSDPHRGIAARQCSASTSRSLVTLRWPGERQVGCEQRYLEVTAEESHQEIAAVGLEAKELGQVLGLTPETGTTMLGNRGFGDGAGDQGVGHSVLDQAEPRLQSRQGTGSIISGRPPWNHRPRAPDGIQDRNSRGEGSSSLWGPRSSRPIDPGAPDPRGAPRHPGPGLRHHQWPKAAVGPRKDSQYLLRADARRVALGQGHDSLPAHGVLLPRRRSSSSLNI